MMLVSPGGTLVSPSEFEPQATTVPLLSKAKPKYPPAAIAVTLLKPGGMFVWPETGLLPQTATVPSALRATLWEPPAAISTTFDKFIGTLVWPKELSPQARTVPSALSA